MASSLLFYLYFYFDNKRQLKFLRKKIVKFTIYYLVWITHTERTADIRIAAHGSGRK